MRPLRLNRRSLLRGACGAAIALPWLEAMQAKDARGAQDGSVARRFIGVYQPGGTVHSEWIPSGTETTFELSPILAPFEVIRQKLLILSGLAMSSAVGEQSQAGLIALLTGTPQGPGDFAQGPSLDQVLSPRASQGRPIPSLHFAVRWGTGKSKGVVHPVNVLAYADDAAFTPIAPQIDPQAIWQSLFGAADPQPMDGALARQRSVLDYLDRRYQSVSLRLGVEDRQRLEQHLETLRGLEATLATLPESGQGCSSLPVVDTSDYDPFAGLESADDGSVKDPETDAAIPKVGKWMMDMLVMAMACDLTGVATLQWADTEADYTLPWLDLLENHSFYQNEGGFRPLDIATICTWYSQQHAYLLERMDAIDMGGHTLLDESVVFFGSEVQDPATHLKNNMPFLLGGCGGGLSSGRWLSYNEQSHNDLLVAILNRFGDERQSFGFEEYCSGPLEGLV
jgi:hypothetical protein